jgi:hypothetical protein
LELAEFDGKQSITSSEAAHESSWLLEIDVNLSAKNVISLEVTASFGISII